MTELLDLMAAPFAACVILVGIHAYLGMHVIQRKVIFVDLALAQIAALGATFGFLLGVSPHSGPAYFFSLGFAIVGAAIFALTRMRHERIPQEAIIGIVYAAALAAAILVADRAPEGAEHIRESMVGAILWVGWPTIVKTGTIYALIGLLHVILRKRFFQISFEPERAYAERRWVRLWDFIFYVTFAFVITSSVAIAGVLLVFSFLVIPAVIATLFARAISTRLAIGWTVGIAACIVGLVASYRLDMPSGPTVVTSLAFSLILAGLLYYVVAAERRTNAILKLAAGVTIVVGLLAGATVFFTSGRFLHIAHEHDWEQENHTAGDAVGSDGFWEESARSCAGDAECQAAQLARRRDWIELSATRLGSTDPDEREAMVDLLGLFEDPRALDLLAEAADSEPDPLIQVREVALLASSGDGRGYRLAVRLLESDLPPLVRDEAHDLLLEASGQNFGYNPFATPQENSPALQRWQTWASSQ